MADTDGGYIILYGTTATGEEKPILVQDNGTGQGAIVAKEE